MPRVMGRDVESQPGLGMIDRTSLVVVSARSMLVKFGNESAGTSGPLGMEGTRLIVIRITSLGKPANPANPPIQGRHSRLSSFGVANARRF